MLFYSFKKKDKFVYIWVDISVIFNSFVRIFKISILSAICAHWRISRILLVFDFDELLYFSWIVNMKFWLWRYQNWFLEFQAIWRNNWNNRLCFHKLVMRFDLIIETFRFYVLCICSPEHRRSTKHFIIYQTTWFTNTKRSISIADFVFAPVF